MKKITTFFVSVILLSSAYAQLVPQPFFSSCMETGFIENKGQVKDQHGRTNNDVRFIYSDGLFNLQLKHDGFSYELFEVVNGERSYGEWDLKEQESFESTDFNKKHQKLRSHRIDVKLPGARSSAEMVGQNATGAAFNFYTSNVPVCGITGVASYNQVIYKNIYAGIDLVFYAPDAENESPLKYEWIVHPGAHPEKIRLQYEGVKSIVASSNGGFKLMTSLGTIDESEVIAYYEHDRSPVTASYRFDGNRVGYELTADRNKTLVIDPNIVWSTYFGGEKDEDNPWGRLTTDYKNKPIIVGNTKSIQYIASTGAHQTTYAGGEFDAFAAKFTTGGKLSWATYYGGTQRDEGIQVITDLSNNVYVTGFTKSPTGISTPGAHQVLTGGGEDSYIVKFDESGIRQWATYFGGAIADEIYGIVSDENGNIYITGYTASSDKISTPGSYQELKDGAAPDAFLSKLTPDGDMVWSTFFGGPGVDRGHGIALGNNGELYFQGTGTSESGMATAGTHQTTYGGGPNDSFIAKWDTNGNLIWCTYYGGEYDERGREIETDEDGDIYVIGMTTSKTAIATPGAVQPEWSEAYLSNGDTLRDGYVAKFNADGLLVWGTYYGGFSEDQMSNMAIDRDNEVLYVGGRTLSEENISTPGSFQPDYSGSADGMLAKFTLSGTRLWGTYIVASGPADIRGLALDKKKFLYIYMRSDNSFSVTPATHQSSGKGGVETVVIKFSVADTCYDSYESNNSFDEAKLLKVFSDTHLYGYTAAIDDADDEDWFKVKIPENSIHLKLELTDLAADYDLKLYQANGQLLVSSANPGTADESIIYNNAPKVNYRIEVSGNGGSFDPNACYRIKPMVSAVPWPQKQGDALEAQSGIFQIHVFPNPCSNQLNMKITSDKREKIQVTLLNLVHQSVTTSSFEITAGTQSLSIPVDQLPAGMYLLEIVQDGKKITSKVVVH